MHLTGYLGLLFSLLAFLFLVCWAGIAAWSDRHGALALVERGQLLGAAGVALSSLILLFALMSRDYSFQYVYENVDNTLDFVYTLTAFWGGREGSLLFWELALALCGAVFVFTPAYRMLSARTRLLFWMFFLAVQAYFLLLLTCWSNPFIEMVPPPADGRGLNPLLRNPGMIFHPPLLFLGFAGYAVPACCALAASIGGEQKSWVKACRNWNLLSWVFLTAGIVLGGWWSYMELGWGGYWAWDPVENASLIPWFAGTAVLHTSIIESRRNALQRTNVLLMGLTFLLCVFSTYLTRSGVIDSLHTFGESGVSAPLFWGQLVLLLLTVMAAFLGERHTHRTLSEFLSRQGMLVITAWFLLALGMVVTLGTMWPVISKLWTTHPMGLDAHFYNRVCLPFLTVLVLLFGFCPWFGWKGGIRDRRGFLGVAGVLVVAFAAFFLAGVTKPLAALAASAAVAAMASIVLFFVLYPPLRRVRHNWGVYGIHLGLALLTLGIAFSGPYKIEREVVLAKGQSTLVGGYAVTYVDRVDDATPELRARAVATLAVSREGKPVGTMRPDKRIYRNFERQQFSEVATLFSLGDEVYATLLGFTEDDRGTFKISINPLVNWLWIGGTIMCLMPFLAMTRLRRPGEER